MKYEARAYGTRQEIADELTNGMGGHRSARKMRELEQALGELRDGADRVRVRHTVYVVTDPAEGVTLDPPR